LEPVALALVVSGAVEIKDSPLNRIGCGPKEARIEDRSNVGCCRKKFGRSMEGRRLIRL